MLQGLGQGFVRHRLRPVSRIARVGQKQPEDNVRAVKRLCAFSHQAPELGPAASRNRHPDPLILGLVAARLEHPSIDVRRPEIGQIGLRLVKKGRALRSDFRPKQLGPVLIPKVNARERVRDRLERNFVSKRPGGRVILGDEEHE